MAQERVDQVALTADESLVIRMTLALGHEALPKSLKEIAAVLGFSSKMAVSRIEKRAIKKIGLSTAEVNILRRKKNRPKANRRKGHLPRASEQAESPDQDPP